jgi:hypothetical protein
MAEKINRDMAALHSVMNTRAQTVQWIAAANAFLTKRGATVHVTETVRTAARQGELWRQGRNRRGVIVDSKRVVTFTLDSLHEYRLAFDWVPAVLDKSGRVKSVLYDAVLYDAVYRAVPPSKYGLERLSWEYPHLQIAGGYKTAQALQIRANAPDA